MCTLLAGLLTVPVAVGATRDMVTGNYKWDTGVSIPSENFYKGASNKKKDCIQMLSKKKNFQYDDLDCEKPLRYVCEKFLI
ncbi:hypothetical protein EB796_022646 [Bugula neritina]|uniref:C-type lectin domain-containing protein n=1 Tax=Bugula neritina TaxID=10212 RepID=A0A7J7IZ27_BUGNE|nr:hypothetical protein EB796_022646 [Bugula neritina]